MEKVKRRYGESKVKFKSEVSMKSKTPLKVIRAKCLDCTNNQPSEIRRCIIDDCPLFNYRFGNNPSRKGIGGRVCITKAKSLVEQEEIAEQV
jgi:hypothetical protein